MGGARVVDLTGRRNATPVQVEWGVSYEFLVSLCAFGFPRPDTLETGRAWFGRIRRRLPPEFLEAWEAMGPAAGKMWVNFVGLATRPPAAREVPELLERIASLSPLDLRLHLLGYHVPAYQGSVTSETIRQAAEGDGRAQRRLLADREYFSGEADPILRPVLALDASATRDTALLILDRWYRHVVQPNEDAIREVLGRDGAAKSAESEGVPPERLIELASGIQFVPHPDIRQVFLIPQIAVRPWVLLCEHDDARLFCYPVADGSLRAEDDAPPPRLLRVSKALADAKRLRMLRYLGRSSASLQEIADHFRLPKTTAHHHLAILRAAGLVRMSSELERRHSMRLEAIPELTRLLEDFLGAPFRSRDTSSREG